ncbi:MAG: alpha/beta hydrolase [Candidatus Eisenbacteria bacterium]|nr:alpha/beta hydrolase [Candidatus Eisenbacteria bacterium]
MRNVVVLAGSAFVLFVGSSTWLALYPPVPADLGGVASLDARAEPVRIPVGAHDQLRGWYLPPRNGAVIAILHGFGRDHERAWRYAGFLRTAGYGVLTFDFRSSRVASRLPTTLGHYEVDDARAALAWLEARPELAGARIGLLGESLGGSVSLIAGAGDARVRALVVDCPFSNGVEALGDACERWAHVPRWPSVAILRAVGRAATGCDPGSLDAVAASAALRDRPVFFIHALEDDRLAPREAQALWRAAGAKDPLWLIRDAGHNEGWKRHRALYESRVRRFFDRALRGRGPGLPAGDLAGDAIAAAR